MTEEALKGKRLLVVDDEPDVLDIVGELLEMADLHTARNFEEAKSLIEKESFDLVILDIMGVDGFGLLNICRSKNIPATMLTAHSMSRDSLNKARDCGAVSFLPKTELSRLPELVAEILDNLGKRQTHWKNLFKHLGPFFKEHLGVFWEDEKDKFPKTFY